jgi:hypothetical protein
MHRDYGVNRRLKAMQDYALRLEDYILEMKGICKYLETPCDPRPTPKVTQIPRSVSSLKRQALLK